MRWQWLYVPVKVCGIKMLNSMLKNWKKLLSREGVDVTTISIIDLVFFELVSKFSKTKKELFFTKFQNKSFTHYIGIDQFSLGRQLYKQYFFDIKKILKYCQEGNRYVDNLKKNESNLLKQLECSDRVGLLKLLIKFEKDFLRLSHIFSITSYLALEAWQYDFDKILQDLIRAKGFEKQAEILTSSAYLPIKPTALSQLMSELKPSANLKKLIKKYQFLRSWSAVWYSPIDEQWIENLRVDSIANKVKYFSNKKLINVLKPTGESLKIFKIAPYAVYFKDFRDDVRRAQVFYYSSLFEYVAKYFKVSLLDLGYLTMSEIKQCLVNNKFDYKKVELRKTNQFVVTIGKNGEIIVKQSGLKKYFKIEEKIQKANQQPIVKGVSASKGRVIGQVKIIHSHHDIKRVKAGDIIVANTTHPDYLPAMKLASGFITNEGGLISHAAIIARELNKPCVVGTKNATFILIEGQTVELNANTGEIKVI